MKDLAVGQKRSDLGNIAAQKLHLITLNDFKVKSLKLQKLQGFFYADI